MRRQLVFQQRSETKMFLSLLLMFVSCSVLNAFPATSEDERLTDREPLYASPGAHQLASWLTAQLRRNDYVAQQQQDLPLLPYRLSGVQGKRNSELTNSMMGIPRNMIDNGKK